MIKDLEDKNKKLDEENKELHRKLAEILVTANNSIYFNDSSDYLPDLYVILREAGGNDEDIKWIENAEQILSGKVVAMDDESSKPMKIRCPVCRRTALADISFPFPTKGPSIQYICNSNDPHHDALAKRSPEFVVCLKCGAISDYKILSKSYNFEAVKGEVTEKVDGSNAKLFVNDGKFNMKSR